MEKKAGYRQIYQELRADIQTGALQPGSFLPPERQLCERWGVERTTLRRALTLLARENFIEKKSGVGSIVKTNAKPIISFITTGISDTENILALNHHFLSPICEKFSDLCEQNGYQESSVTIVGSEAGCLESFRSILNTGAGFVLADNIPESFLRAASAEQKPCVLLSQRSRGFRSVLCDNENGMLQAIAFLSSCGHKKIAFLGGEENFWNVQTRADGFQRAAQKYGLPCVVHLGGWNMEAGEENMLQLLRQHPDVTAVCAVNDAVAAGVCRAVEKTGRSIPNDFSVVGFGDTLSLAGFEQTERQLTSVRISPERLAQELWNALLMEMRSPFQAPAVTLVEAALILRDTTPARSRFTQTRKENFI